MYIMCDILWVMEKKHKRQPKYQKPSAYHGSLEAIQSQLAQGHENNANDSLDEQHNYHVAQNVTTFRRELAWFAVSELPGIGLIAIGSAAIQHDIATGIGTIATGLSLSVFGFIRATRAIIRAFQPRQPTGIDEYAERQFQRAEDLRKNVIGKK